MVFVFSFRTEIEVWIAIAFTQITTSNLKKKLNTFFSMDRLLYVFNALFENLSIELGNHIRIEDLDKYAMELLKTLQKSHAKYDLLTTR